MTTTPMGALELPDRNSEVVTAAGSEELRVRRLEQSLESIIEASGALLQAEHAEAAVRQIVDLASRIIDAEAYAVWRRSGEQWSIFAARGLSEEYCRDSIGLRAFPRDSLAYDQPMLFEDVDASPILEARRERFRAEGIRALLAVPLLIHGSTGGTITFYYRSPRKFADPDLRIATALGNIAAAAIGSAEMREARENARLRSVFAAEASVILASSLDYETTLASVARLAVPRIADWCAVDVLEPDGALRQLALEHKDPSKIAWARELSRRYPPDLNAPQGARKVVRTGVPEMVPEISDEMLMQAAVDAGHLELLRQAGFSSYMAVPLATRGRILGVISFVYAESGHRYTQDDLALAEDLARRAAVAIDNARLYAEATRERGALAEALRALQESEARFRRVVESNMIGIHFADLRGVVIDANDAFLKTTGYSREEMIAGDLKLAQITPAEYRDADARAAAEAESSGSCAPYEKEFVRQDGSRVPVLIGGAVDVGFSIDLSERKLAEAALRQNEERLRLALDAGRMGIWDWNIVTNELEWTKNLEPLHGFAPGTFAGNLGSFLAVVHEEDRPYLSAAIERAVRTCSPFEAEFRVVWPDGSTHWVFGKGQAFADASGRAVRMLGLGLDITERKLLEEKVRDAQKLESVGLLAGGIAHDFNNLLTGMLGNASLALDLVPPHSPIAALLEDVVGASERAADLTRQLLAYSGRGKFIIRAVDLSAEVRAIAPLLYTSLSRRVPVELDLAPNLPPVEADPAQVQQVIMNLAINAAEATGDRGGVVSIRTGVTEITEGGPEAPGNYAYLQVEDHGCGMDGETRARIFDPFFTTKFTGRGLGLAAVFGIVRAQRGLIHVASELGCGSTFQVMFPAAAVSASTNVS